MPGQVTHPKVNRAKYAAELEAFQRDDARYRTLGVFLLTSTYPVVTVAFATPQIRPAGLLFAMRVDYTDFDLKPPSVRFVDPFDGHELKASEMPTKMRRTVEQVLSVSHPPAGQGTDHPQVAVAVQPPPPMVVQTYPELLQDYGPDTIPFLCLAGTREYHDHPGHSGDPWELHRTTGAGSLARLINIVRTYAVEPVGGWSVELVPKVTFAFGQPPA